MACIKPSAMIQDFQGNNGWHSTWNCEEVVFFFYRNRECEVGSFH